MKSLLQPLLATVSLLVFAPFAMSAALNLSPLFPDQVTFNAPLTYVYDEGDCLDVTNTGGPASGACGDSKTNGQSSSQYDFSGAHVDGTGGGTLTVVDGNMTINIDGGGNVPIVGSDFELVANFDYTGQIIDATLSVFGSVDLAFDPAGDFDSGTLALSSSLLEFGFSGDDVSGSFEFILDNATGDMLDLFGGSVVAVLVAGANFAALAGFGDWDSLLNNDPALFTQSFSGTTTVDTFVPVPAAIWLFMSAFGGLIALRQRY